MLNEDSLQKCFISKTLFLFGNNHLKSAGYMTLISLGLPILIQKAGVTKPKEGTVWGREDAQWEFDTIEFTSKTEIGWK